jgi:hypothetical protein
MIISYEQFYKEVKDLNRKWFITRRGEIREIENPSTCPWLSWHYKNVIERVARDVKMRYAVFDAADNHPNHNPQIRKELLKCTGLANE